MLCKLCGKNTQCMCRGGGCKQCGQSNPQVEYTNKVVDLWTDTKLILENLDLLKTGQRLRIDPYLIWDKLTNDVDFPDDVKEAIENNKPLGGTVAKNRITNAKFIRDTFIQTPNPNVNCDFDWDKSPWAKCKYCNSIQRYIKWKVCPAFIWNKKEDDVQ